MYEVCIDYIEYLIDPFINPQKRVFLGYLGSAFVLAMLVQLFVSKKSIRTSFLKIFALNIWASPSARADYKVLLINQAFMMGVAPQLLSKLALTTLIFETLHIWLDGRVVLWSSAPDWIVAVIFTVVLFLSDDLAKYCVHRVLHKLPLLWCFHKVHHTAETLTPLTVYRTHPVEAVIFGMRSVCVQATVIASFIYFFGNKVELVTLLGASAFLFIFNVVGSNLRHSHIWISYGCLVERIFISPAQHQIHHSISPHHHDRNFGAVLAVWDWLGGSLWTTGRSEVALCFGVGKRGECPHNLKALYMKPIFDAVLYFKSAFTHKYIRLTMYFLLRIQRRVIFPVILIILTFTSFALPVMAKELNIYSHRQPFLIQPFIEAYEAETGTKVNIVYASKGLAQRLQAEGSRSPADLILTVDIARLYVYADKKLLAPVSSETLIANIPSHLRDPHNHWFAFSKRARVIVVGKDAKDASNIRRYEDLVDKKWEGRLCLRPGSHVYNRALVASMINAIGADAAETWAKGLVANLARRPQGNDRAQVKAIFEGVCDISIINNYYYGKLKFSDKSDQREWAKAVTLIFPNQGDRGTHINISGGGVVKYSKNKEEAVRFLEFLTSEKAQSLYGSINFEYPVRIGMTQPAELISWGIFQEDQLSIGRIAELAPRAQRIIDRVGW